MDTMPHAFGYYIVLVLCNPMGQEEKSLKVSSKTDYAAIKEQTLSTVESVQNGYETVLDKTPGMCLRHMPGFYEAVRL